MPIDAAQLHAVLMATLNMNNTVRRQAEEQLKQLQQGAPGFTVGLLQITNAAHVKRPVRLMAGTIIKNSLKVSWLSKKHRGWIGVAPDEQQTIRDNVWECMLCQSDSAIRNMLIEIILIISQEDFPEKWPKLLPELMAALQQQPKPGTPAGTPAKPPAELQMRMFNSLLGLQKMCGKYKYRNVGNRKELMMLQNASFATITAMMQSFVSRNEIECAMAMKVACKYYFSGMTMSIIDTPVKEHAHLRSWFACFIQIIKKPLPEASAGAEPRGQPTDIGDRLEWPWWKLKKWVFHIIERFFHRYGIPDYIDDDMPMEKAVATLYLNHLAGPVLEAVMHQIDGRNRGEYVSDRVMNKGLAYVSCSIEPALTWKMLKPHMGHLLFKIVLPTMSLSREDIEEWQTDPHEFVRRAFDVMEDFTNPKAAARELLIELVMKRRSVLPILVPQLRQMLEEYAATPVERRTQQLYIRQEGVLAMVGTLEGSLKDSKAFRDWLEPMLLAHVLPEFKSPVPFLRARASWMVGQYASIDFKNPHTQQCCVQSVLKALRDRELPVSTQAAASLKSMIGTETTHKVMGPIVPEIVQEIFRLMNQLEVNDIIDTLGMIVHEFSAQILPIADQICRQLVGLFQKYHRSATGDDEEMEEVAMAAGSVLDCVYVIIAACADNPGGDDSLIRGLVPEVMPMIQFMLVPENNGMEYIDKTLGLLSWFPYAMDPIPPAIWGIVPQVVACQDWAFDYMTDICCPLEQFIEKGIAHYAASGTSPDPSKNLVQMICGIADKTFKKPGATDMSASAARLLETTLLACIYNGGGPHPGITPMLPAIIEITMRRTSALQAEVAAKENVNMSDSLYVRLFCNIAAALQYDAPATIAHMARCGGGEAAVGQFFGLMLNHIETEFKYWKQDSVGQKSAAVGLCAYLAMPAAAMPEVCKKGYGAIFTTLVKLLSLMDDLEKGRLEREARKASGERTPSDSEDEEEEALSFDADDADVTNPADEKYLEALRKLQAQREKELSGKDWDSDDDILDDDPSPSPLDKIDHLVVFFNVMQSAQASSQGLLQAAQQALPDAGKTTCQALMQKGAAKKSGGGGAMA